MADIIRLADRRSNTTKRPQAEAASAQILLFTGVRYERIEPLSKRSGSGAKRSKNRPAKRAEG